MSVSEVRLRSQPSTDDEVQERSKTFPQVKKREKRRSKRRMKTGNIKETMFRTGMSVGASMANDASKTLFETSLDDTLAIDYAIFNNFTFPFENLVLEGGGMKGLGYIGAFQVLDEANILPQIKRICGVSIGSILATLLIVGYSPKELKDIMMEDLNHIIIDHKCGLCSLIPNLRKKFGWNPAKRLRRWMGEKIKAKRGTKDLTFKQLYDDTGKELCIVVTNVSQMNAEYFHVKTTPNIAIAEAVRISVSIPGMFQATIIDKDDGSRDVYVDGGVLCNFPIHAFDGWYLSLKPEDSFFKKLASLDDCCRLFTKNERFSPWNEKTLGIVLFAEGEAEFMKSKFRERRGSEVPYAPKTKFSKLRKNVKLRENEHKAENARIKVAMDKFLQSLQNLDTQNACGITLEEFGIGLQKSTLTDNDYKTLFGTSSIDEIVEEINNDNNDQITYQEVLDFIEKKGIDLTCKILGHTKRKIESFTDFLSALESTLSVSLMKSNVDDRDVTRTIGINTGYVGTTDFEIEDEDRIFVMECGAKATRAFLREYCQNNPKRRKSESGMIPETIFRNRGRDKKTERFQKLVKHLSMSKSLWEKPVVTKRNIQREIVTSNIEDMGVVEEGSEAEDDVFSMQDTLLNELQRIKQSEINSEDEISPKITDEKEKKRSRSENIDSYVIVNNSAITDA